MAKITCCKIKYLPTLNNGSMSVNNGSMTVNNGSTTLNTLFVAV